MTAAKRWAAAGSSAAVLAGGLFLGAPAAVAAPDDACLAASAQAYTTLTGAGMSSDEMARVLEAGAAVHTAAAEFNALVTDADARADLQAAQTQLETAVQSEDRRAAQEAWYRILGLQEAQVAAVGTAEIAAAHQVSADAAAAFQRVVVDSPLLMRDAGELLGMFFQVATHCEAATGEPAVTTDGTLGAQDQGRNQGINMQTAEEAQRPGPGLLAGLVVAAVTLTAAAALWLRRGRA